MSEKLFMARWGRLGTKTFNTGRFRASQDHFKAYRQYTDEDISTILNLRVNQEWCDTDKKRIGEHCVRRVK